MSCDDERVRRSGRLTRPTVKAMEHMETEAWIRSQQPHTYDDHQGADHGEKSAENPHSKAPSSKSHHSVASDNITSISARSKKTARSDVSRQSKLELLQRNVVKMEKQLLVVEQEEEILQLQRNEETRRALRQQEEIIRKTEEERVIKEQEDFRMKTERERILREDEEKIARNQYQAKLDETCSKMKVEALKEELRRTQEAIENSSLTTSTTTSSRARERYGHQPHLTRRYEDNAYGNLPLTSHIPVPPPTQDAACIGTQSGCALQTAQIAKMFADSINISRLPIPEPAIFTGDPLKFFSWMSSFSILIESKGVPAIEKIHYLKKYLGGSAIEVVEGLFDLADEDVYDKAKRRLEERYGNRFLVSEAFRNKLEEWPRIKYGDGAGLRRYGDFLHQVLIAMSSMDSLSILNDCRENRKMLTKLSDDLVKRWSRQLYSDKPYPDFKKFVTFVTREADILCNPMINLNNLQLEHRKQHPIKQTAFASGSGETRKESTLVCVYCERKFHSIHDCISFQQKTPKERNDFLKKKGICFGCLVQGHLSRYCPKRSECKQCSSRHPTCLHGDYEKLYPTNKDSKLTQQKESISHRTLTKTSAKISQTSMTVPVYLSVPGRESEEFLVYCMLDTQSDTSFITEGAAKRLNTSNDYTDLKLSTMTSTSVVRCRKICDLRIRGMNETKFISLPTVYSRDHIPLKRSHIPTTQTVKMWNHLSTLKDKIPDLQDCEVGLLIGYNCPQALAPRAVICGNHDEPYAQKTDLGWSIVGMVQKQEDDAKQNQDVQITHSTMTSMPVNLAQKTDLGWSIVGMVQKQEDGAKQKQDVQITHSTMTSVSVNLRLHNSIPNHVHYAYQTSCKELSNLLENDFSERHYDRKCQNEMHSQNDIKFLEIIDRIRINQHGYYECTDLFRHRVDPDVTMFDIEKFFHRFRVRPEHCDYLKFPWWKELIPRARYLMQTRQLIVGDDNLCKYGRSQW